MYRSPIQEPHSKTAFVLLGAWALSALAACNSVAPAPESNSPANSPLPIPALLSPGTEIEIRFFNAPELNDLQAVGPEGTLDLQLVGEVHVLGQTAAQLGETLRELYGSYVRDVQLSVVVRSQPGRVVVVGGQVNTPGAVPLIDRLTLLEAVLLAGGPSFEEANVRNVVVVRQGAGREAAEREAFAFDLLPALKGEKVEPFYLQPRDLVFVPRSEIAEVNQWINQHVNGLIPQLGLTYETPIGSATFGVDTRTRRD